MRKRYTLEEHERLAKEINLRSVATNIRLATRSYRRALAHWHFTAVEALRAGRAVDLRALHADLDRMAEQSTGRPARNNREWRKGVARARRELLAGKHGHPTQAELLQGTVDEDKDEHFHADTAAEQERRKNPRLAKREAFTLADHEFYAGEYADWQGNPPSPESDTPFWRGYHYALAMWHARAEYDLRAGKAIDLRAFHEAIAKDIALRLGVNRVSRVSREKTRGIRRAERELWQGRHGHPTRQELMRGTRHEAHDEHWVSDEIEERHGRSR